MDRGIARFALVSLLVESPHELRAMGAEDGLSEELGDELMAPHFVDFLMFDGTASSGDSTGASFAGPILWHLFCGKDKNMSIIRKDSF